MLLWGLRLKFPFTFVTRLLYVAVCTCPSQHADVHWGSFCGRIMVLCFLHSRMCHLCITCIPSCVWKYRICTNEPTQISADNENLILVWLETGSLGLRTLFASAWATLRFPAVNLLQGKTILKTLEKSWCITCIIFLLSMLVILPKESQTLFF